MARSVKEIESEIRLLSTTERVHLLRDLVADLDGEPDPDVEKAWLEEAERRYQEVKNGLVETIPAEEVFVKARERLAK